jgi:hypothetical protein
MDRKLLKRVKRTRKSGLTDQDVIALAEAKITDKLLKRAHKHGMTDQEVIALAEAWKRAAKATKYLKLPLRAQELPNSGPRVGL